jgi:hypothetical protein
MEETLEGGRGPPRAVVPLEREREREREREGISIFKISQADNSITGVQLQEVFRLMVQTV